MLNRADRWIKRPEAAECMNRNRSRPPLVGVTHFDPKSGVAGAY